jgi:hypothetical protein
MGEGGRRWRLLFAVLVIGGTAAYIPVAAQARVRHLRRVSFSCVNGLGLGPSSTSPTAESGVLDPAVTSMFAILRQPAGPNDQLPPFNPLSEDLGYRLRAYFPAYLRQVASGPDGDRYFLVTGFERGLPIPPARCLPPVIRRHRAQLVAEQREREAEPVYCIEDVGPGRAEYGGANCQPFAAIETGANLIDTDESTSDVVELAPDGVATVRLLYPSGATVTASVANNAFDFLPPQQPIREAAARERSLLRKLRGTHGRGRARGERRLFKLFEETSSRLGPATVEWLGPGGQLVRSFHPGHGSTLTGTVLVIR